MNRKMDRKIIDDPDEIAEIAKNAFRAHFSKLKLVRVNVKQRLDQYEEPVVDVKIIYEGKFKHLKGGGILQVQHDIVSKAWRDVDGDLGFPVVHFIAKSDLGRCDLATV